MEMLFSRITGSSSLPAELCTNTPQFVLNVPSFLIDHLELFRVEPHMNRYDQNFVLSTSTPLFLSFASIRL